LTRQAHNDDGHWARTLLNKVNELVYFVRSIYLPNSTVKRLTSLLQLQGSRHHPDDGWNARTVYRFCISDRNKDTERAAEGWEFLVGHLDEYQFDTPLSAGYLGAGIVKAHGPQARRRFD